MSGKNNKEPVAEKVKKLTPKASEMVDTAIRTMENRKGSSLAAIRNFISGEFSVDVKKWIYYIKAYITKSLENGHLIKTGKGVGLSGRFKLAAERKKKSSKKAKADNKTEKKNIIKIVASTSTRSRKNGAVKGKK